MKERSWTHKTTYESGPVYGVPITSKYLTVGQGDDTVWINEAMVTPREARDIASYLLACALQVEVRNTVKGR